MSVFKQVGGKKPFIVNWNQHSVRRQRPLSICRNWPVGAREHLASGGWLPTAPLLFCPASQPWALHVHCSSVLYASGSLGPGAPITDAGSPLPLLVCSLFWLATSLCLQVCLSIVEAGSSTPRGPAIALPHSLFRIQTAAMPELLAMLVDPFVCHWKIQKDNIDKMNVFLPCTFGQLFQKSTA